jgi:hypothetical protein
MTDENAKAFIFKGFMRESERTGRYAPKVWMLGCTGASGASASMIIAATASVRKVTARRSTITAISTTAVMKNERCVRDLGAGQPKIKGGGGKGRGGRPFLDWKADGQRRDQRQQRTSREEHHAGDHRHVIPGHGELPGKSKESLRLT